MTTIIIVPRLIKEHKTMTVGDEYIRVCFTDNKNRYIDMTKHGIIEFESWDNTAPIQMEAIVLKSIIDIYLDEWRKTLELRVTLDEPFIYHNSQRIIYTKTPSIFWMNLNMFKNDLDKVESTIKYRPMKLRGNELVPSHMIPDEVMRIFDYSLIKNSIIRPYLSSQTININVEDIVDENGFVTYKAGFESFRERMRNFVAHDQEIVVS